MRADVAQDDFGRFQKYRKIGFFLIYYCIHITEKKIDSQMILSVRLLSDAFDASRHVHRPAADHGSVQHPTDDPIPSGLLRAYPVGRACGSNSDRMPHPPLLHLQR